jgi:hypothetical protein
VISPSSSTLPLLFVHRFSANQIGNFPISILACMTGNIRYSANFSAAGQVAAKNKIKLKLIFSGIFYFCGYNGVIHSKKQ